MRTGSWMKIMVGAAVVALAAVCAWRASGAEIRNVTARQRFPWNGKVDISYEVVGGTSGTVVDISATDKTTGKAYAALSSALSGDAGAGTGTHKTVWDLSAQGIELQSQNVVFAVEVQEYCVVDLSSGSSSTSYPVSYLYGMPSGGWSDEYKTTKLVLRRIEAGTFIMGATQTDESHRVTLTKPFYIGVFEVTQKQYQLIMGSNPSSFSGAKRPVEKVSYNMIRGSSNGAQWPSSSAVDASSFMGKLRARTGLEFDLPTEVQWEYACRAGTTTEYSYGNSADGNYMWYGSNSSSLTHDVGTKSPNAWGLYDMHGNVWEWCLDWYGTLAYGTDPEGVTAGSCRVLRGGGCYYASRCRSAFRHDVMPDVDGVDYGFRLARTLSE